jgi:hypothetical protein
VDREFNATETLNQTTTALNDTNNALVTANLRLAEVTAALAAKDWNVAVNVQGGSAQDHPRRRKQQSPVMTITLGSFTNARLTVQPFGYEGEARDGLTARTFTIGGLLSSTQWQALVAEYNTWRNLRIADPDTLSSGTVGTTINLTISSTNGLSITNLPCWFVDPPSGDQIGPFINATATLVDAAQALAVELRTQEKSRQRSELLPDLGTLTFGSAVVTLTKPAETAPPLL